MIVVRVELHSAVTGKVTELGRMIIANVSGTGFRRNYSCETLRGRSTAQLDRRVKQRVGVVADYPAEAIHVWHLVVRSLLSMGYK